tara:strand:+ start:947 stop:1393 length:447 start_codon:yes stop_codon:yes gene_type:complete
MIIESKIKSFVNFQKLGFVATVNSDNSPNLSPKGTVRVWDDENLVFANINSPKTIENLNNNNSIEINVVDPIKRKGFRFKGNAKIISSGNLYNEIVDYYKKNGTRNKISSIVMIKVTQVDEVVSPLYDLGISEKEVSEKWTKHFLENN